MGQALSGEMQGLAMGQAPAASSLWEVMTQPGGLVGPRQQPWDQPEAATMRCGSKAFIKHRKFARLFCIVHRRGCSLPRMCVHAGSAARCLSIYGAPLLRPHTGTGIDAGAPAGCLPGTYWV